ncbi:MAG: peptidase [Frankiales bacterium]|nr:peptidase [Frankiales bacterium]
MTDIQELIEYALSISDTDGCIVLVEERTEANLRWANNDLTTNGQMTSRSFTVISIIDGPDGSSPGVESRSITTAAEIDQLVADSAAAARSAGPAEDSAPLIAPYPNEDGWDGPPSVTGIEVFHAFAQSLGQALGEARAVDLLLYGFAEHVLTTTYLASSTGLRRRWDQPTGRLELNGKSRDLTRSAWAGVPTRDFSDVDIIALVAGLSQRLEWAKRKIDLPAGRYETILPPTAVADLMVNAYWTASARDAAEGRNVYAASNGRIRVGERLSPLPLTLRSDPAAAGLQCAPFVATRSSGSEESLFDNGLPLAATDWITDGVLSNLMSNRSWSAQHDGEPRPPIDNLTLDGGGTATLDDLIASTKRGLLLTCLWYIREVDPQTLLLTGLTRDGVYLIEDGKVVGAVNNYRFNESPVDMLSRITEVGASVPTLPREWGDYFTRTAMPPVRVSDFNMSTVSQAK